MDDFVVRSSVEFEGVEAEDAAMFFGVVVLLPHLKVVGLSHKQRRSFLEHFLAFLAHFSSKDFGVRGMGIV